jgi:eukaryotic-like serine/threonine-protein kinase
VLATGTVLDQRYVLEERLGRGGMADVFRAVDTETDELVAVKILHGDMGGARRFRSEVETLGRLDHPNIVGLRGSGVDDAGVQYLVLDLIEGPTLTEAILDEPFSADRTVRIAQPLADALAHAHANGVVHRDVKPSNILLDSSGEPRLGDFGVARLAATTRVTATGIVVGSAPYLAPEQVEGVGIGPASDTYALGLVLVECLTGTPCFAGSPTEAALARLHHQPEIPDTVPPWLRQVLAAMTERDPHRRPTAAAAAEAFRLQSVDPVVATTAPLPALVAVTRQQTPAEPVTAVGDATRPLARPRWIERALVLVALAVVSILAWNALAGQSADPASIDPPLPTPSTIAPPPSTMVPTTPATDPPVMEDDSQGPGHGEGGGKGKGNGRHKDHG